MQEPDIIACEVCIDALSFAALYFHTLDVQYAMHLASLGVSKDLTSPVLKTVRFLEFLKSSSNRSASPRPSTPISSKPRSPSSPTRR